MCDHVCEIMKDRDANLVELQKLNAAHQEAVAANEMQQAQSIRDEMFSLADINQDDVD